MSASASLGAVNTQHEMMQRLTKERCRASGASLLAGRITVKLPQLLRTLPDASFSLHFGTSSDMLGTQSSATTEMSAAKAAQHQQGCKESWQQQST